MASPFPGMNPWLESADVWTGFHDRLINETVRLMQPQLRTRGYYIDSGERVWLTDKRPIVPDDAVFAVRPLRPAVAATVAVLEPDEPVRVKHAEVEHRETYAEIFDAVGHQLVTGIEYLSPTNKSNQPSRELYVCKQKEMRVAGVHLVEIDFLRRGPHVLDVPMEVLDPERPWDYMVNLVRQGSTEYEFYPIRLRNRLPRIRIPLKAGDEDAVLDLQQVFEQAHDYAPYPERIQYSGDPAPPRLSADDANWADQILRSQGLRQ